MQKDYKIKACVVSNCGKLRNNHEDNFLLDDGQYISKTEQKNVSQSSKPWDSSIIKMIKPSITVNNVFAVSDGMGGHNAGEEASRLVVEQLFLMKDYIFQTPDLEQIKSRFQDYVVKANAKITLEANQHYEFRGMGATLSGVLICEAGLLTFNLGDSRTYAFNNRGLLQLTTDHTEGQRLLNLGVIKPKELHLIENAKALIRYLGVEDKFFIPQAELEGPISIKSRTWLLICSDGLTDMLSDEEIGRILREFFSSEKLESAACSLLEKALEDRIGRRGGIDNITVMLVEVEVYSPTIIHQMKKLLGR